MIILIIIVISGLLSKGRLRYECVVRNMGGNINICIRMYNNDNHDTYVYIYIYITYIYIYTYRPRRRRGGAGVHALSCPPFPIAPSLFTYDIRITMIAHVFLRFVVYCYYHYHYY